MARLAQADQNTDDDKLWSYRQVKCC